MNDEYSSEEVRAIIHGAFGLQIQRPKRGVIAIESDGTNPAAEPWTVPVKVDGQEETYYASYNPLLDATALADGSPVDTILNYEGGYEIDGLNAILGRAAYATTNPTSNFAWKQHDHENAIGGGQLDASAIFDAGAVQAIYGGTGQSSYAVGDILYASTTTALSKLADVATGNALISGGVNTAPAWGKIGLTTHISGTLATGNGGTGLTAAGTDGNVLTASGGVWVSAAPATPTTAAGWTDDGTVVRLTTSTDNVTIGSAADIAKLGVVGDADEVQFLVRANATQTGAILSVTDSGGSALFFVEPTLVFFVVDAQFGGNITQTTGGLVINDDGDDFDSVLRGNNDTNLLYLNAGTDRVGIGDDTPDGRFAVVGRADEIQTIIRGNATQTSNILEIQDSDSNVQVSISGTGAAVFNEEGNDADFRIESDTQVNAFFLDGTNGAIQQLGNAPAAYLHMAASTASLATYRVPAGTVPSSPGEGDAYNDSTLKAFGMFLAGIMQFMPGRIFTATANAGPSNTTAETSIVGTGIGTTTLAANALTVGKVLKIRARGMYSTGGSARDVQIRIKLGGVTVGDATISSTAAAANGGRTFLIDYDIRCVSTGAGGTVQGQGYAFGQNVQQGFNTNGTSAANTTGALAIDVTADFVTSDANCHFTSNILYFELVN